MGWPTTFSMRARSRERCSGWYWQSVLSLFRISAATGNALPRPEPFEAMVRAGFDARWYNDSGVGVYVAQLLRALAASGEIDLVVYEDPRNPVPGLDGLRMERVPVTAPKY